MREWLKVMLEEIQRKRAEGERAAEEHRRRESPPADGADAAGEPGGTAGDTPRDRDGTS